MNWTEPERVEQEVNRLADECHRRSVRAGWWATERLSNIGTKLCLIHSEISEAMEGYRKDLMDDHLPHRPMIEVELADAVIRIGDLAAALRLDLGGAILEKMEYNLHRHWITRSNPDRRPTGRHFKL